MTSRHGTFRACLGIWLSVIASSLTSADDCNQNGIEDLEEIATGAVEDCDGDGFPDECETRPGGIAYPAPLTWSHGAHLTAFADLNGDGVADALAVSYDWTLTTFLGHGKGAFSEFAQINVISIVQVLLVVHVDADEAPDVVVFSASRDQFQVLRNLGDGEFARVGEVAYSFPADDDVACSGDFDGDGDEDLAIANPSAEFVFVAWNDGTGAFSPPERLRLWRTSSSIVGADVDGDGDLDLVTSSSTRLMVVPNEGDGIFAFDTVLIPIVGDGGTLERADLNKDGADDLALAHADGVAVMLSDGVGGFLPPVDYRISGPNQVRAADIDGDGDEDLVTANPGAVPHRGRTLTVFRNDGEGVFSDRQDYLVPGHPLTVTADDLDGDGDLDLMTHETFQRSDDRAATILRNDGDGNYTAPRLLTGKFAARAAQLVDLDADGEIDIVALVDTGHYERVSVYYGEEEGLFAPESVIASFVDLLRIADFDADGTLDLLTRGSGTGAGSRALRVRFNNGDRTFFEGPLLDTDRGADLRLMLAADLDGDSASELLIPEAETNSVIVMANNGAGGLRESRRLAAPAEPRGTLAWDLELDGDTDVLISTADGLTVLRNQGDGSFRPREDEPFTGPVEFLHAANLDGDGPNDVIGVLWGAIVAVRNDRSGTLAPPLSIQAAPAVRAVAVSDVDGDGRDDVLAASEVGSSPFVSVLGNPPSGLTIYGEFVTGAAARAIAAAQVESDGRTSVAIDSGGLTVFRIGPLGASTDCNENGVLDSCELEGNDCDQNGHPDECDVASMLELWIPRGWGSGPAESLAATDLDGDERSDVVFVGNGRLSVLWGDGARGFSAGPVISLERPRRVVGIDLDRDGNADLAVLEALSSRDGRVSVFWGNGTRDLPSTDVIWSGELIVGLAAADVDGDGDADLLTSGDETLDLLLLRQGVPRTFSAVNGPQLGLRVADIAARDLSGDGRADVAVAFGGSQVAVVLNDGTGNFGVPSFMFAGEEPRDIVAEDVDGDRLVDLVVPTGPDERIAVFFNIGAGRYSDAHTFEVGGSAKAVAVLDLDGDGRVELVSANRESCCPPISVSSVSVLRRVAESGFEVEGRVFVEGDPYGLESVDLDGDGTPELVLGAGHRYEEHAISVLALRESGVRDVNANGVLDVCESGRFRRGDSNDDSVVDVSDAIHTLDFLFLGNATLLCLEAADVDNDGGLAINDPVFLLGFLFLGGPPPAPPGPPPAPCGPDPDAPASPADIGCDVYSSC